MRLSILALATIVSVAACDQCSEGGTSGGQDLPRLFTDTEIEVFERSARAAGRENALRECKRAPLRGAAVPGKADGAIVALIEPEKGGEIEACLALVGERGDELSKALREGESRALSQRASALGSDESAGVLGIVEARCAPVLSKMREALQHEDACSAYLPGRREKPDRLINLVRLSEVAAVFARKARREGRAREAAEIALDGLRFNQDLCRGGSEMIFAMLSTVGTGRLAAELSALIGGPRDQVTEELLSEIDGELSALIEGEPHPADILLAEGLGWVLEHSRGTQRQEAEGEGGLLDTSSMGLDRRDEDAASSFAIKGVTERLAAACREAETFAQCRLRLDAEVARLEKAASGNSLAAVGRQLASDEPREAVRRRALDVLEAMGAGAYGNYLDWQAGRPVVVAALRFEVAVRREAIRLGRCPEIQDLAEADLGEARTDPLSRESLVVTYTYPGLFVVTSDELQRAEERRRPRHEFRCAP